VHGVHTEVVAYNIGYLAYVVGRTPATVRGWEKSGLLPRTPFSTGGKSERVYTDDMVKAVKNALDMRGGSVASGDRSFYIEIHSQWKRLGIEV
jgi:hypothetical protein